MLRCCGATLDTHEYKKNLSPGCEGHVDVGPARNFTVLYVQ